MTKEDSIWNRACEGGGAEPRPGDLALAALLRAHGLTMNGGVLHAVECLSASELSDATSGYRFFGLDSVAELLVTARQVLSTGINLETQESVLNRQYAKLIPDDSVLVSRFGQHFRSTPSDFAAI